MDRTTLMLARIFSVVAAGLFSYLMIDLVSSGNLGYYLNVQKFEYLVQGGGVLLGLMVLLKLRAMFLAYTGHSHHHDHDHDHDDHDHDDHDHEVSLWRLIVLAVPLMILLSGRAPKGLSADFFEKGMSSSQKLYFENLQADPLGQSRIAGGRVKRTLFKDLISAANDPLSREVWQSIEKPIQAKVSGQYISDDRFENRFRLMRIKIVCCAADATPLGITVLGKPEEDWEYGQWLEVTGPVSFVDVPNEKTGRSRYYPVLHLQDFALTSPKPYIQ